MSMVKVHRVLGWSIGVYLLLLSFSGAILLFKTPLLHGQYPVLEQSFADANLDSTAITLAQISKQQAFQYINLPSQQTPYFLAVTKAKDKYYFSDSGQLLLLRRNTADIVSVLVQFHHHLLLKDAGKSIIGWLAILSFGLIVSGFIHWWPKSFCLRVWRLPKRVNLAYQRQRHVIIASIFGFIILLPLVSSIAIIYKKPINAVLSEQVVSNTLTTSASNQSFSNQSFSKHSSSKYSPSKKALAKEQLAKINGGDYRHLLTYGQSIFEGANLKRVYPSNDISNSVTLRYKRADEWHPNGRNSITVDLNEMRVTKLIDTRKNTRPITWLQRMYPIHVGVVGGNTLLITLLFTAATAVTLFITGTIFGYKRRLQRLQKSNRYKIKTA